MTHHALPSEPRLGFLSRVWISGWVMAAIVLSTTGTGCTMSARGTELDELPENARRARMIVMNRHRHGVEVFVNPSATSYRIGWVDPVESSAFRLPIVLNGVAARVHVWCPTERLLFQTPEIVWGAQSVVDLQVQAVLNLSRVMVQTT